MLELTYINRKHLAKLVSRCFGSCCFLSKEVADMPIHESGEDYLEAIYVLGKERGVVRSIDVAHHLKFSKPSVSRAVRILIKEGMLIMEKDRSLTLTKKGLQLASLVYERHIVLTKFLESIGVSPEIAEKDACLVEHDLSDESFEAIQRQLDENRNKEDR